ncbi:ribonuclease Y [Tessaracoccus caeni]|uniref:ribonuclease Y n=1 Tax=Tessaracoccus caeni TaxID=3031239 RepID=UPI0023DAA903|nr:ribonuclease Y [Tessaracoccus caeni]MDF1487946.1 ribonuclease Y [Tessaracoccus caeni]
MPGSVWGVVAGLLVGLVVALVVAVLMQRRQRTERERWDKQSQADMESVRASAQETASLIREDAQRLLDSAEDRARESLADTDRHRQEVEKSLASQRRELREARATIERRESRLSEREDRLAAEMEGHEARAAKLADYKQELKAQRLALRAEQEKAAAELERVANLTVEEARNEVIAEAERQARLSAATLVREIESSARRDADKRARQIVVSAMQRCASELTSESVVTSIHLPSDDMKGRIIGREGRNIRAFEQITGVNVLIDDTPESVLLSCFDPVRRETARMALASLVADGRIHPARIEEVYEISKRDIAKRIEREAEDALAEVGIVDLHPDLIPIVGSLAFRTSYGQNVLRHLVECAHLAGVMAAELGLDIATCKRAAFLHDIGKALTHEVEGPHALIGAELLRKHGEHPDIVHAVEAHHNEVEPETVEAILVQAADAISGSRPGARRESLEAYVERMSTLESIATSKKGVTRAYAMQAGREVRVMVAPDRVDDSGAHALAREIAQEVEKNLSFPGQIKITVVRESRATATAH